LLCLASTAFCDEAKTNHFRGMPTNEVIAFDDFQKSLSADDLAGALGVRHWNFQIQVPDGIETIHLRLQSIEGKKERDLGYLSVVVRERDATGQGIYSSGVKQSHVVVVAMPTDTSVGDPLFESKKLRIYARGSISRSNSSRLIDNPFRQGKEGVATYNTSRRVRDRKAPPGVWDGFGTRFDLMGTADDKTVLRISFEAGDKSQ
jgi:hypothetical protein